MSLDPKVGDVLQMHSRQRDSAAERTAGRGVWKDVVEDVTVTRVGRKYVYVAEGSYGREAQFNLSDGLETGWINNPRRLHTAETLAEFLRREAVVLRFRKLLGTNVYGLPNRLSTDAIAEVVRILEREVGDD